MGAHRHPHQGHPNEEGAVELPDLEAMAREVVAWKAKHSVADPVHAFVLSKALKIDPKWRHRCAGPAKLCPPFGVRMQALEAEAHRIAHYELKLRGVDASCRVADVLARNILLNPGRLRQDLKDVGRNIVELKRRHPHVSCETILEQICSVAPFEGGYEDWGPGSEISHAFIGPVRPFPHFTKKVADQARIAGHQVLTEQTCVTLLKSQGVVRLLISWPRLGRD